MTVHPVGTTLASAAILGTAVALVGFAGGLRMRDRTRQEPFTRAIQIFLAVSAAGLLYRAPAASASSRGNPPEPGISSAHHLRGLPITIFANEQKKL